jgi:hypothetical protein
MAKKVEKKGQGRPAEPRVVAKGFLARDTRGVYMFATKPKLEVFGLWTGVPTQHWLTAGEFKAAAGPEITIPMIGECAGKVELALKVITKKAKKKAKNKA